MIQTTQFVIATQTAQFIAAVVLTGLLAVFFRVFRHRYLRHWALSFASLAIYLATATAALVLAWYHRPDSPWRLAASLVSLAATYPHMVWLLMGAYEATTGRMLARGRETLFITLAVLFGLATVAMGPFDPAGGDTRILLRVVLRYALTGGAFLAAGMMVLQAVGNRRAIGPRVVAFSFLAYGLQLLHVAAINVWHFRTGSSAGYLAYMGIVDLLIQMLIGLGIVIWLLEFERRRARRAQDELAHISLHDKLTDLPNRTLLKESLHQAMIDSADSGSRLVVLSLGIARFDVLNQSLGWQSTELLIRELAGRLRACLRPEETVGRSGDHRFLVLMPELDPEDTGMDRAESLISALFHPIRHEGRDIYLTLHGGMSLWPDQADTADELIRLAEQAQSEAAATGQRALRYRDHGARPGRDPVQLESELRQAVEDHQFALVYQPIIHLEDRRTSGFEALVRWNHPERGLLAPGEFLATAASLGLLDTIENRIMLHALDQLARWQHSPGQENLTMAVNLSAQRFQRTDLVETVAYGCKRFEIDPECLHLEITESTALQDFSTGHRILSRLRDLGVQISLDDFGTGYSSLSYLRRLPVDIVKLDRSFLSSEGRAGDSEALVHATVDLAHSLGMDVIAEGVETESQLEFLKSIGCNYAQGFFLHRPATAREIGAMLDEDERSG